MTAPTTIQLGNLLDDVVGVAGNVIEGKFNVIGEDMATRIVRKVTIESEISPPIVLDLRAPDDGGTSQGDAFLNYAKPRVTLDTTFGPVIIDPNGTPGPTKWPYIKWGSIGLGIGLTWLILRGIVGCPKCR